MNAVEAFRRERGLLSGDDLSAWLEAAGLDEEAWVRRVLAGDTAGLPGPLPRQPVDGAARAPSPVEGDAPPHEWAVTPAGCGDAALRLVCRVLRARPRQRVGEDATLAEIVAAAGAAGLHVAALKASRRRMRELPAPWIAHVDGGHWLVVHRVDRESVVVSDPARGAGRLPRAHLEARWSGWCAVFAAVVQSD